MLVSVNGICFAAPPATAAKGAVVMEVGTGRVLYKKNPHEKMPMASTTKIMTAILAIEKGNLNDIVTVSDRAYGVEGSSIYLSKGEKITLENLLYGLMLRSGNDSAAAVAEHIGGTEERFVKLMNQKAEEIGAKNTHFMNPHGLHHDDHYTTAYDLALISAYAMKNPTFRKIVSTKYKKIPWEGHKWDRVMKNKNDILWSYVGGNGIKTGYTKVSKRCLATAAIRSNMQLVCVVLNCQPWFEDSMALLDYGFNEYEPHTVLTKDQLIKKIPVKDGFDKEVGAIIKNDVVLPVRDEETANIHIKEYCPKQLTAPVKADSKIGYIEITLENQICIKEDLYAANNVKENTFISNIKRIFKKWIGSSSLSPSVIYKI